MTDLSAQLAQLENAQLVRRDADEDQAYLFRHALTQEVSYDSLLLRRRREVHHRVAEAYEQLYADDVDAHAALLAQHFRAAEDDGKLVEYAIRAGDHAGRLSAEPEARAHYALAIDALSRLPDTDENRRTHVDTLIKLMAVSFTSASPDKILTSLHEAESLVENLLRTPVASSADRLRLARVQAWSARMHFFWQDRRAALQEVRKVLPVAQDLGDVELAALSSNMMGRIWLWGGEFGRALSLLEQTLALLEQRENWTEWILNRSLIGVALAAQGNYHAGVEQAERAIERAKELNHLSGAASAYSLLALIHLMGDAIESMLAASRLGLEIGVQLGNVVAVYTARGTQAWAESRLGQHQAAGESLSQAEAIAQMLGGHMFFDDWLAAIRVEMALNAGQLEETLRRAKEATDFARSVDGKFAEALIHRFWGIALFTRDSKSDEVEAHFRSSLELFEAGQALLEAARTRVEWGKILQARSDWPAARGQFEKAMAQFQTSGLTSELEQTKRLMISLSST